jgi:cobyrinic acid a,c-diamide synthase
VLLVVDVRAQAASAAAVVRGFATHRQDIAIAGVMFNRTAGDRHAAVVSTACRAAMPDLPILGVVPRRDDLILPERHLGLVQAGEMADLDGFFDRAAGILAGHVDLAAIRQLALPARFDAADQGLLQVPPALPLAPPGQRVAVACDVAFSFAYPLTLAGWREAGAAILPFSPLADEAPAADADAVYLPGGYPELHAGRLAGNRRFLDGLRTAAGRGALVWGECGGYMVLGEGLICADGHRHAMAGLLGLETSFAARRLQMGYRRATLALDTPIARAGARFRGHEFHYARIEREHGGAPLFSIADASGRPLGGAGLARGRVVGSFIHLIDRDDGDQAC